ncbi:MAG: hypothetical protein ABR592_08020 [Nitriliruptorales bacterium]
MSQPRQYDGVEVSEDSLHRLPLLGGDSREPGTNLPRCDWGEDRIVTHVTEIVADPVHSGVSPAA